MLTLIVIVRSPAVIDVVEDWRELPFSTLSISKEDTSVSQLSTFAVMLRLVIPLLIEKGFGETKKYFCEADDAGLFSILSELNV